MQIEETIGRQSVSRWENNGAELLLRESIKTPPAPPTPSMLILPVGVESVQNTILNPTITSALHGLGGAGGGLNTFLQPTWMSQKFNIIEASPLSELSLDAFKFAACEF